MTQPHAERPPGVAPDSGVPVRPALATGPIGLGCWAIGGPQWTLDDEPVGWGEVDDQESVRAIRRAVDLGAVLFDTADMYGAGRSERILGQALAGRRNQVLIASKFGNLFDEPTRRLTGSDGSPEHVRVACEASLRRLGTDRIDLYLFHLSDFDPGPAAGVRDALEDLVAAGLIRAYGWSTDDPERARVFAQGPHCAAVEHALNVLEDAPEMLALCAAEGLLSVNRSPLAMGLLSGKFDASSQLAADDIRGAAPDWLVYFRDGHPAPELLERLARLRAILTSGGRTQAQGALAWILARGPRSVPIPGFRTVAQVESDLGAAAFGPLGPGQMAEIERLLGREPAA